MKILVVGGGGREHAIVRKLLESPKVEKLYCAPGNGGISCDAECVDIKAMDIDGVVAFAKEQAAQGTPAIYLYDPGQSWCIWDVSNELLEYPAVYFVEMNQESAITEERIAEYMLTVPGCADEVIVKRPFASMLTPS